VNSSHEEHERYGECGDCYEWQRAYVHGRSVLYRLTVWQSKFFAQAFQCIPVSSPVGVEPKRYLIFGIRCLFVTHPFVKHPEEGVDGSVIWVVFDGFLAEGNSLVQITILKRLKSLVEYLFRLLSFPLWLWHIKIVWEHGCGARHIKPCTAMPAELATPRNKLSAPVTIHRFFTFVCSVPLNASLSRTVYPSLTKAKPISKANHTASPARLP
jgi:hypothetical protein